LFIESIYAWLYVILDITICDLKLDVTVCDVWFRVVVQLLCVPVPIGSRTPSGANSKWSCGDGDYCFSLLRTHLIGTLLVRNAN